MSFCVWLQSLAWWQVSLLSLAAYPVAMCFAIGATCMFVMAQESLDEFKRDYHRQSGPPHA